jgi:Helix-turn-helix domain
MPGLRREAVADLAGVGLTWYTWLVPARPIPASAPVVDAIARALRLDPDQYRHLRVLANLPAPSPEPAPAADVQPRLLGFSGAAHVRRRVADTPRAVVGSAQRR